MSSNKKRQRAAPKTQPEKPSRPAKRAAIKPSQLKRSQQENCSTSYDNDDNEESPLPERHRRRAEPLKQKDENRGRRAESESTDEVDYFSPSKLFRRSSSTVVDSDQEREADEDEDEEEDDINDKDCERLHKYVDNVTEIEEGLFAAPRPGASIHEGGVRVHPPPLADVVRAKKKGLTAQKIARQEPANK